MTEKLFWSDGCRFSQAGERSWVQVLIGHRIGHRFGHKIGHGIGHKIGHYASATNKIVTETFGQTPKSTQFLLLNRVLIRL